MPGRGLLEGEGITGIGKRATTINAAHLLGGVQGQMMVIRAREIES